MGGGRRRRNLRQAALGALAVLALAGGGCAHPGATRQELMLAAGGWFGGIADGNLRQVAQFDAHAPTNLETPEAEAWARGVKAALDAYEMQKLRGQWQPDPVGYIPVKALLLGANPGTFWGAPAVEGTAEEPVLVVQPTFAYDEVAEQDFVPGTKIYIQGFPVGTVYRLEIGGDKDRPIEILDSLRLRIHFRRIPGATAEAGSGALRYRVVKAELVPGSEQHRSVRWVY